MADEKETVATPPTPAPNAELETLKESVKKLEAKNYELIGKLQNQKKAVPDDYDTLVAYKQKHEQQELEKEGKYTEAKQAMEQQYREDRLKIKNALKNWSQETENLN